MSNSFDRALLNGIPRAEAADFFLRIKQAGWADPPDETGALEGQFAAPIEQVIAAVSNAATAKFKLMVAYHVFAESMRGVAQHACAEVFHEHAEHERAAAEAYLKRAAVLGSGPVHLAEIETPPASSDPVGILMMLARAEQEAIALQGELRQMVGEMNPLAFQVEQFMVEDQHHLDELWQMLPQDVARTPVIDQAVAGAVGQEPTAEELPVEESSMEEPVTEELPPEAKMAFARALQKLAGDVIQFPGKGERMLRNAGKLTERAGGAIGDAASSFIGRLGDLPGAAQAGLGGAAIGALSGGLNQAARVQRMSGRDKREAHENGGPLTEMALKHPGLYGAGMGGLSMGGALGTMVALGKNSPMLSIPASVAAGLAPAIGAVALDKHLKGRQEKVASAFRQAIEKLALQPMAPGMGAGTDAAGAPVPDNQPVVVPTPSMAGPGVQPRMATEPGMGRYAPVNYLEAEETGRRAQEQNEAGFYRSQAEEAKMQAQGMGAQVADIQAQLDQLSAQAAESQNQVMTANEEAVRANDQMLNQATLAARMRMGMQQLRAQMMEIASQDPEQLAAAAGGPTPMDVGAQAQQAAMGAAPPAGGAPPAGDPSQDPGAQPGTPGASPDPSAAPGSPPAGAGGPSSGPSESANSDGPSQDKKDGGATTVSIKKGSAQKTADLYEESMRKLPAVALGGLVGAGAGYLHSRRGANVPNLRAKVDELKGQQTEGGFGKAIELGRAQTALAEAEESRSDPRKSALKGGLLGASIGAGLSTAVPAIASEGKQLFKNLSSMRDIARQGV